MKKIFLVTVVAAFTFSLTACGDSPEKLSDDAIELMIKCNDKKELSKEECKNQEKLLEERKAKLSKEDQKKAEEMTFAKILIEMKKAEDAKKAKKQKEKEEREKNK